MTTTAIASRPLTAEVFLFGDKQDTVDALARALHEQGVVDSFGNGVKNLSRTGRDAVSDQIGAVSTDSSTRTSVAW